MLKLTIALLMGLVLHLVTPQIPPHVALAPSHQGLAQLLFTSPIMALNPQLSVACFTDYISHLNVAGEAYSRDYKICLLAAKEERKLIEVDAVEERREILTASEAVCSSLRTCNAGNNTMELFHCHSEIGANNTKLTYAISGNASEYASILQERYRLVELHQQQCSNRAEREYVTNTANNYSHLQACLEGRVKPRPAIATTTTNSTTKTAANTTKTLSGTNSTTATSTTRASSPTTDATNSSKTTNTEASSDLPQSTTPPPVVGAEEQTTTDGNGRIQAQIGQFLNLLN